LLLNLILIILAAIAVGLARTRGSVALLVLLLCPMAYYVSHLVAVANHDYRYMYPATLLMQILAACGAGERAVRWVHAQVLALKTRSLRTARPLFRKTATGPWRRARPCTRRSNFGGRFSSLPAALGSGATRLGRGNDQD
jgi:hypothetical protein